MTEDAFDRIAQRERDQRRRRRHGRARRLFRVHAWIFVAVNAGLVAAWVTRLLTLEGEADPWFLPTLLGWGTALAVHRYAVRRAYQDPVAPGGTEAVGGTGT